MDPRCRDRHETQIYLQRRTPPGADLESGWQADRLRFQSGPGLGHVSQECGWQRPTGTTGNLRYDFGGGMGLVTGRPDYPYQKVDYALVPLIERQVGYPVDRFEFQRYQECPLLSQRPVG